MEETLSPSPAQTPTTYFPGGQRLAFFLLLIGILAVAFYTVKPVLVVLLLAAAAASLSFKWYRHLTTSLGGRKRTAALLLVLSMLIGILGPLVALLVAGAQRLAGEITQVVPRVGMLQGWLARVSVHAGPFKQPILKLSQELASTLTQAAPVAAEHASLWATAVGAALIQVGIAFFLFAVSVYYFYVNGEGWRERFIRLLPIDQRHARAFIGRFRQVSIAVMIGNLGTAAIHGVISGLGYWMFGVSAPLLWGLVTAIASFIPAIGTALVWVPLSIGLAMTVGIGHGLLLAGYCIVIVGAADNFARPMLMEKRLGLHPLFVFVAVFGGLATFGMSGLFLGPLVMALAVAGLDIYEEESRGGKLIGIRSDGE